MIHKTRGGCAAALMGIAALSLMGCLPEDEPNDGPELAWQTGSRAYQPWDGDPNYPAAGTLPYPSGHGVLELGYGLDPGDLDSWPISMWDYDTETLSSATGFMGTLWVSQGDTVELGWSRWISGEGDDAIWRMEQPWEIFTAPSDAMGVFSFEVGVDGGYVYSLELFGGGANYGFILAPIME